VPSVIRYRPALRAVVVTAGGSSGSSVPFCRIWSQVCGGRRLQHVIREENLLSLGTIITCTLSESRSAIIF